MVSLHDLPPLSLYVHLPWCVRKCPYCDFNSHEAKGGIPEQEYIDALLRDLDAEMSFVQGRRLQSIFFGGGTPSLFSGESIARLLHGVRARVALAERCEVTLEANPGTAEAERFEAYREAGVTRLSMGVQSLRDEPLRKLGRIHNADEAVAAFTVARRAGFDNINLDLMYALPDDDIENALDDLRSAVALNPAHLSWYQLTLEPNTAFHRSPPRNLPDEDRIVAIEEAGRALLANRGYARYEVSAYSRPDRRSEHNLNYWTFGDYLGIGAGAHGKVTYADDGRIERRAKQRNPRMYMQQAGRDASVTAETIRDAAQLAVEFMMNALRLCAGVPAGVFSQRTGLAPEVIGPAVEAAIARGWMEADPMRLKPTTAGMQFLNSLIALFDRAAA